MKFVLYLLIILGATLLGFDLATQVRNMEKAPPPAPTQPVPLPSGQTTANPHTDPTKATQHQIDTLSEKIQQTPENAALYLQRAKLRIQIRQLGQAITDLDHAATLAPDNPEIHFQRGYARIATGNTDLALADFSRALTLNPTHTKARLYRSILRYRNARFQDALDDSLTLLKHDPTFHDAHITASRCYMELQNKAKAVQHLETYIAHAKDPAGIREARQLLTLWNQKPDPAHAADTTPSEGNE